MLRQTEHGSLIAVHLVVAGGYRFRGDNPFIASVGLSVACSLSIGFGSLPDQTDAAHATAKYGTMLHITNKDCNGNAAS
jgi:hypothetical protein